MARKTLAFAKWQYPYTLSPEQAEKKAQLKRLIELQHPLPSGANKELYRVFFEALEEKKAKWMDETKDYCKLDLTATLPEKKYASTLAIFCTVQYNYL